jgi:hypothetical protein
MVWKGSVQENVWVKRVEAGENPTGTAARGTCMHARDFLLLDNEIQGFVIGWTCSLYGSDGTVN